MTTNAKYVLGMDVGPNSIGWAMLEVDEDGTPVGLLNTEERAGHPPVGVRVFEAGLDNFDTSKESSLNQKRRMARSMRRNHQRRNKRKAYLRSLLVTAGLLPADAAALDRVFAADPYALRARALVERLEPYEVGRALYHIAQRRGFKSNRKSANAKEDGQILKEIGALRRELERSGCATLGAYLYKVNADKAPGRRERLRGRHTSRDMYMEEFDSIVETQRRFHPEVLTDDFVTRFRDALFYQRPFEITPERRAQAPSRANLHRAPSVKPCVLEPGEVCCSKAWPEAQEFRIRKETANLRVQVDTQPERPLNTEEKQLVLTMLFDAKEVSFDKLRKAFQQRFAPGRDVSFNLERGNRKKLQGDELAAKLKTALGKKQWEALDEAEKTRLKHLLVQQEDPDALAAELERYELDDKKRQSLIAWNPPDGYMGYSRKALTKLLEYMRQGDDEYTAIQKAYPNQSVAGEFDRLPALISPDLPHALRDITNPVVRRAMVELRKVVNALIREHGKPAKIVVELARELKMGKKERSEYANTIRQREKDREEARQEVKRFGGNPQSRDDVNKWLLWKEQGGRCLYTGKTIPPSELFHSGEWEVDHILPHWRSLDDSLQNKVVTSRAANQEKKDRTPAEWLGRDSEAYRQMVLRAKEAHKHNGLPGGKLRRLTTEELRTDEFVSRQLNDTRYISTLLVAYLQLLYPPALRQGEQAVAATRGGLTAVLRRQWGLNDPRLLSPVISADGAVLEPVATDGKSRADHRHHAIDAAVIAATSRAMVKRYQDYCQKKWLGRTAPTIEPPWPHFAHDLARALDQVNVSHRVQAKIMGALHEETFYGPVRDRHGNIDPNKCVFRRNLEDITTLKQVDEIVDGAVRALVLQRVLETNPGIDLERDKSTKFAQTTFARPLIHPRSKVPIKRVRCVRTINNRVELGHRVAVLGNNHHIEFVDVRDPQTGAVQLLAVVVPMWEAAQRVHDKQRWPHGPVQRTHENGALRMALARKDSVLATNPKTGETTLCVVQKLSGDRLLGTRFDMTLRDARDARPASEGNKRPFKRVSSVGAFADLNVRKVTVDPLGRVWPAGV